MAEEKIDLRTRKLEWMLQPCDHYNTEYTDCKCMRARFYQYYIFGELLDCSQWKVDYENCKRWKSKDDDAAYNALVASEQERRLARLQPHYRNDVWTKREHPPDSWNSPLPEWMQKNFDTTLLDYKQKALESGNVNDLDPLLKSKGCDGDIQFRFDIELASLINDYFETFKHLHQLTTTDEEHDL